MELITSTTPYSPSSTSGMLARGLKRGDREAIEEAAAILAQLIPADAVVAAMPSHTGEPTYMGQVLKILEGMGYRTEDAFRMTSRQSLYKMKKKGERTGTEIINFSKKRGIYVIDNVIATAETALAALRAGAEAVVSPFEDIKNERREILDRMGIKTRHHPIIDDYSAKLGRDALRGSQGLRESSWVFFHT